MDRLIYTAASGAKHILEQQATTSNNLANLSTTGFRAQLDTFRAVPVQGEGLPTRAFVVNNTVGADFSSGPLQVTGRDLDVAIKGKGWIAVQNADGTEAYTRNGALQMSPNGVLQTSRPDHRRRGRPDHDSARRHRHGRRRRHHLHVSNAPRPAAPTVLGRIKLVNPPEKDLVRGDDGLFRLKDGAQPRPTRRCASPAAPSKAATSTRSMPW
jgi:flagellar basal-body rod protein FlgF